MSFTIDSGFVVLHGRGQYIEGFSVGFWLVGFFLSLLQCTFTDVKCTNVQNVLKASSEEHQNVWLYN